MTNYTQAALKETGFTRTTTLVYLLLCAVIQICAFYVFYCQSGRQLGDLAVTWWEKVSRGETIFARQVSCLIQLDPVHVPSRFGYDPLGDTPVTTTCKLPMNSNFELVYLVLWFWFMFVTTVTLIRLYQCIVFACSSTLRFDRLSEILEGVDELQLTTLAYDVDLFFQIESFAGEIKKLEGQQLLDVFLSPAADNSSFQLAVVKTEP